MKDRLTVLFSLYVMYTDLMYFPFSNKHRLCLSQLKWIWIILINWKEHLLDDMEIRTSTRFNGNRRITMIQEEVFWEWLKRERWRLRSEDYG